MPVIAPSMTCSRKGVAGARAGRAVPAAVRAQCRRPAPAPRLAPARAIAEPYVPLEDSPRTDFVPGQSSTVGAIILGGGAGTRLRPLTSTRAKPAVPIGGAYRLIDVPMSNCLNSGINKIYILTQFNSTSLNRHMSKTYNVAGVTTQGFVEVLAASQSPGDSSWFQGTADAVRQYAWMLRDVKNRTMEDIVILSGDHLYRMDYMKFVDYHRENDADITIGCLPCTEEDAQAFGLMKIDDNANITEFAEKPKGEALKAMQVDTTVLGCTKEEAKAKPYIASMGIYVFKRAALLNLLGTRPDDLDFGGDVIPNAKEAGRKVKAYLFDGYWEDIGTIKSFFDANLALARDPPPFEFCDPKEGPILTSPRHLPPARVEKCDVQESIISFGAHVQDATVHSAIIGLRAQVEKGATVKNAMMMGADYFESEAEKEKLVAEGKIPMGVGAGSHIENCILDKNARVGKNVVIKNEAGVDEFEPGEGDDTPYFIRAGIVVVMKGGVIPDGSVI